MKWISEQFSQEYTCTSGPFFITLNIDYKLQKLYKLRNLWHLTGWEQICHRNSAFFLKYWWRLSWNRALIPLSSHSRLTIAWKAASLTRASLSLVNSPSILCRLPLRRSLPLFPEDDEDATDLRSHMPSWPIMLKLAHRTAWLESVRCFNRKRFVMLKLLENYISKKCSKVFSVLKIAFTAHCNISAKVKLSVDQ